MRSIAIVLLARSVASVPPPTSGFVRVRALRQAVTIFNEIMSAEDKSIPQAILGKAEGIAIFPSTIKGGFVVGGMRGRGVISARTASGWSAPAFMTLTGGSIGLQIGGQAADLILVIMQRRGLESLVRNQFKLGADAAVAAGTGRSRRASVDRPAVARRDPQLLAARGPVRGRDHQRQYAADGPRRERAFLRQAARDRSDRPAGRGRHTGAGAGMDRRTDRYARP
jgi:hypothetical protein